jgi:DNA-binding XRE family transcriptional regulator
MQSNPAQFAPLHRLGPNLSQGSFLLHREENQLLIKLDELTWDKFIYPRKNKSNKTIDAYVEAMGAGADFPSIEVQQVSGYENGAGAILILDGVHRWHAYKKLEVESIEVAEWRPDEALDYETHKIDLKLESAERNTRHGDRLTEGDKKDKVAREVAAADPERKWTEQVIADRLGVAQQTINEWISDIRQRQNASRKSRIIKLARLGWGQDEIAKAVGLSQNRCSEIIGNTDFGNFDNLLSEGRTMDYIADYHSMDLALAWGIRLEGRTDQERFEELGWGLRTWDDWRFNACDERFGDDWPGRIPAQLVAYTLFFFTKPGDLIIDPMAGGGVVPDVCLAFGRRCRAFDLATRQIRPEIQYHYWKSGAMEWPQVLQQGYGKKADLIFWDAPYFSKKQEAYEEKADDESLPVSSFDRDEYLAFFSELLCLMKDSVEPGARLAFLNADWRDFQSTPAIKEDPTQAITIFDYRDLLVDAGWQITHRAETPMSSQRFSGAIVKQMQNSRILGTVGRTLLIGKAI